MSSTIELFNPNDRPFGALSNNAYHPMTIDGKKYDTVTNYIYSNMLTTPTFRTIVQFAKIKGTSGLNQELMTAIDFLIDSSKPKGRPPTLHSKPLVQPTISRKRRNQLRYLTRVTGKPRSVYENLSDQKLERRYKKAKEKYGIPEPHEHTEEEIQQAWIQYADTGALKEEEEAAKKKEKHRLLISQQVRKPFESVDLVKLKQQLIAESVRNQMGIYQIYNQNVHQELFNTISTAVHKGFDSRFKNPELQRILVGTGNFPIQYESTDPFLGIGSDGRGANLVGKALMQLRHNLKIKADEDRRNEIERAKYKSIYDTYRAYVALRSELFDNKDQLTEYIGLNPQQIIVKYDVANKKKGVTSFSKGIPSQETIIELYKRDKLNPIVMKEIVTPGTIAINIRKTGLRNLRENLLRDKRDIIFNSYLEYIVGKNYEDYTKEQVEDAVVQQKTTMPRDNLEKLKDRVVDLFKLGMLSASLSERIDNDIESLQIPSYEEIEEAELAELPPDPVVKSPGEENESSAPSSASSNGGPVTKLMKKIFKDDRLKKTEMIDMIISIKGGDRDDYTDWSKEELHQRLDALEIEKWGGKQQSEPKVEEPKPPFKGSLFVKPFGKPIGIFRNNEQNPPELRPFNPETYTDMLMIDHRTYPTIKHYMIAMLIANTGTRREVDSYGVATLKKGMGITDAHKTILVDQNGPSNAPENFLTIHLAGAEYDKINNQTNNMLLSIYTATALNKKFEDRSLQDLLLLTKDAVIRWNSPQNFYLGAGNEEHPGENYVGVTMMEIRSKIAESRKGEEHVEVELDDLVQFVNKDQFVMSWVKMRVTDMCGVVYKLQQYLRFKDKIDIDLNEEERMIQLIKFVLDKVFQPCSSLVELSKKNEIPAPKFFINMVDKCKGMVTGIPPVRIYDNKGNWEYNKEIEEKNRENNLEINRTEKEFWGGVRIEHTMEESSEFVKHQRDEWHAFWRDLNASDASQPEKDDALKNFKDQQKEDYNDFWGIDTSKKTREEIVRHEHQVSELKKKFTAYIRKAERVERHYLLVTKSIAQVYWDRIVVMLSALIKNVHPTTGANIRDVLVRVEMLNSEKANCVRIIPNETDNCIVSALLNLLVGIKEFKEEFSGNMVLDEDDVKLAGSIILNTKFSPHIVKPDEPDSDIDEEEEEEDKPFEVSPSGIFPSDIDEEEEDGYGSGISESDMDEESDRDEEYGENPYFAFKWSAKFGRKRRKLIGGKGGKQIGSSGDLAKVEQQVLRFSPENSNDISLAVMKQVQTIKNSHISPKIKQNRINFFATIR